MHRPVRVHLEDYLQGDGPEGAASQVVSHLLECEACRAEVESMSSQARLLRRLKCGEEVEAAPGFCARVLSAVEAGRRGSVFLAIADPAFGRRLIYACLTLIFVLGSYWWYAERSTPWEEPGAVGILAVDTPAGAHVGSDRQRDREAVLLSLATYRE
ncbi:MAG: hypothetical protein IT159_11745 [Bryobacterales bacterium]|nr:hypothetical protein [Bryobacterales bacterium]